LGGDRVKLPPADFFRNMGLASIIAGLVLLGLWQLRKGL
jgi:hypothetical protein